MLTKSADVGLAATLEGDGAGDSQRDRPASNDQQIREICGFTRGLMTEQAAVSA